METFGSRVRELRTAAGLSQEKLAERLNISVKSVQRYEKERRPDTQVLILLATYFNVSTDYLLGLKSYREILEERKDKRIAGTEYSWFYSHYLKCLNDYTITKNAVYYWIQMDGNQFGGQTEWAGWADEERRYEIRRLRPVIPQKAIDPCAKVNGKPMVLNSETDAKVYMLYGGDAIVREDICREYLPEFMEDIVIKCGR